jgi:hypothetical protein
MYIDVRFAEIPHECAMMVYGETDKSVEVHSDASVEYSTENIVFVNELYVFLDLYPVYHMEACINHRINSYSPHEMPLLVELFKASNSMLIKSVRSKDEWEQPAITNQRNQARQASRKKQVRP